MKKIIAIDPGHGGNDPGACRNSLYEKSIVLDIALRLHDKLVANGFLVVMTRSKDTTVSLAERASTANTNSADLFISLHCNSEGGNTATGTETLIYENFGVNNRLASCIQNEMMTAVVLKNRGIKERPDLAILRTTQMPAALLECAFISNPSDAAKLADSGFRETVADAVCRGICRFYGFIAAENKPATPISAARPAWVDDCIQFLVERKIITTPEAWGNDRADDKYLGLIKNAVAYSETRH